MKAFKIYLFIFTFILLSGPGVNAQTEISGIVKTKNNVPSPFANVLLLKATDSVLVKGTVTDEEGNWEMSTPPGKWIINATMIGYSTAYSKAIHVEAGSKKISIEDLILKENVQKLSGIVIEGEKPLLEKKPDRIVVNVENNISSTGNTVLEILAKSPGVMVNRQSNSLSLNGKTGVTIMIDGKVTNMPADAVVQMLDGMNSANIQKIELITSPPAKYDAAGSGGMINIVLKENAESGTNGNIGLTVGYNRGKILGGNFNLNQRKKQFNWFIDFSTNSDKNIEYWTYTRELNSENFTQTVDNFMTRNYVLTIQNLRAGFEINLNRKTSLSLLVTGYQRNWGMDVVTEDEYVATPDSTIASQMNVTEKNNWKNASAGLGIQHTINQKQKLDLSFDYLYYQNDNPSTYDTQKTFSDDAQPQSEFLSIYKTTPINFSILGLDYSNEISQHIKLEIGAKTSFSNFDNTVSANITQKDETTQVDQFSSEATLDEKIIAGYASVNWKTKGPWVVNSGLRYEHTDSYLTTPEQEGLVDLNYGYFFPSININYKIRKETSAHFSYSRRITRPTYNDMAPFAFLIGPNTFFSGNPSLQPAITDAFELGYSVNQWWSALQFSYSKDEIANFQPIINRETNEFYFQSENLEFMRIYGAQMGFPVYITEWWEVQNYLSYNYHQYKTTQYETNPLRTIGIVSLNMAHTFQLPKGFSMELSGYYQSNSIWGVLEIQPLGALNFGVRKEFKNNTSTISLTVNDIFLTSNTLYHMDVAEADFISSLNTDNGVRSVKLTYTLPFGNKKLDAVNINSGADEERKRVN